MPDFQAVSQQLGEQVRFVGINTSDDAGLADDMAERTGVTFGLLRDPDGRAFQAFDGFGMPTTVFVAADGTVQQTHTGFFTREALVGESSGGWTWQWHRDRRCAGPGVHGRAGGHRQPLRLRDAARLPGPLPFR
jgi:thiol-disulfide isomerase/thioredoxin